MPTSTQTTHWRPAPSLKVQQAWEQRATIWKQSPASTAQGQQRWLFLLDLPQEARYNAFQQATQTVAATTRASYWAAYLSLLRVFDQVPTAAEKRAAKHLEQLAHAEQPVRPVTPMTTSELEILLSKDTSHLATLVGVAFLAGQRMGDIAQISIRDFQLTPDRLLVTIRRGKVIGRIGPFTVSLPRKRAGMTCVVVSRVEEMIANSRGAQFILTTSNTEAERARVAEQVTSLLRSINPELETRSVRRGGLARLAEAGVPVETVLLYSRHCSLAMLYRYLDAGRLCSAHHQQQDAAQEAATRVEVFAQHCQSSDM